MLTLRRPLAWPRNARSTRSIRLIDGQNIEELSVADQKEEASIVERRDISDLGKEAGNS
jgi:hypothetical protein